MLKVKDFLRKNWMKVVFLVIIILITIEFIFIDQSSSTQFAMIMGYANIGLFLIGILMKKVSIKILNYKAMNTYKKAFKFFKSIHEVRYKLYFSAERETIEKYSNHIQNLGKDLLNYSEDDFIRKLLSEKQLEQIHKTNIIIKEMLVTEKTSDIKGLE